MFLVLIKLGPFKFSPYLILIVLLVPNFFLHLVLVPTQFKFVYFMLKILSFLTFFYRRVKNITKSSSAKNYRKI